MSALLKEVAAILAEHGGLTCRVDVTPPEDLLAVTIVVEPPHDHGLVALSLWHSLEYLRDLATLRTLADRYDIDPAALEALLPKENP